MLDDKGRTMNVWDNLADKYEGLQIREDSLDTLVEFPIQRELIGDMQGKRILDLACGSGRKALTLAHEGAANVVGIDISQNFILKWKTQKKPDNLEFYQGDISNLSDIVVLQGQKFDIVLCFQALGYSTNLKGTISAIRDFLNVGGRFILTTAHPFKFVVEKQERDKIKPGEAYRDESSYCFPSMWDNSVAISHATPMISTVINAIVSNKFSIDRVLEPDMSEDQKQRFPHKAEWMNKYFGIIAYSCSAI